MGGRVGAPAAVTGALGCCGARLLKGRASKLKALRFCCRRSSRQQPCMRAHNCSCPPPPGGAPRCAHHQGRMWLPFMRSTLSRSAAAV